jgi:hypothetical protein
MIKRIVSIVVFLLLVNACYRLGMVYFHDQEFKDAIREYAILASQPPAKADEVIRAKVMGLAEDNQIPLDPDYVEISRRSSQGLGEKITIKFAYAVNVAIVPGYERRFDFDYVTP